MPNIDNMLKLVPADKIVMGIANYGYDWPAKTKRVPHPVAQAVTFQQGVVTAVESESDIVFDPDTLNPHYSYEDENNHVHNVWMLDGVTAYNELRAAERAGVRGTALWRLGMEDPSIWDIWDATHADDATRAKLAGSPARLRPDSRRRWRHLAHHGDAEKRPANIRLRFVDRMHSTTKASRAIRFRGASSRWARRRTKWRSRLTTGPIPQWTPQILDVLKQKGAVAHVFRDRRIREPETRTREARISAKATKSAITPSRIRNSTSFPRSELQLRIESHRAAAGKQPGREDHAFPPALRNRPPAGNGERNSKSSDSAGSWATSSSARESIRTTGAK